MFQRFQGVFSKTLARINASQVGMRTRKFTTAAAEDAYSKPLRVIHISMAVGVLTCFGTVQLQQRTSNKELKGTSMWWHKSVGLLVLAGLVPRLAIRMMSKVPPPPEGSALEKIAGKVSHVAMYGFMTAMPVSGVMMGYYSGKGLPFFFTTIPGASKQNVDGSWAGWAFGTHKWVGQAFEYFLPLHIGAVGFHALKGQQLLARITPFVNPTATTAATAAGVAVAGGAAVSVKPAALKKKIFGAPPKKEKKVA